MEEHNARRCEAGIHSHRSGSRCPVFLAEDNFLRRRRYGEDEVFRMGDKHRRSRRLRRERIRDRG
jgi:hypothetical protein